MDSIQAQCPNCGQFVGPASRCPHCNTLIERPISLRLLRIFAWFLALGGLLILYLYTIHRPLPLIKIDQITPLMNFASVRMQGMLEGDPRPLKSGAYFFQLSDGVRSIAVFSSTSPEKTISSGTEVEVTGSLQVDTDGRAALRARSVQLLSPHPTPSLPTTPLSSLSAKMEGDSVRVSGKVLKRWDPPKGSKAPHKIILSDGSTELEVVCWFTPSAHIKKETPLTLQGTVSVYQNQLQLKLWNANGIQEEKE